MKSAQARAMAADLFYTMKALDVDMANIQPRVADSHNPIAAQKSRRIGTGIRIGEELRPVLASLHVYSPKMSGAATAGPARGTHFGECELDMPRGFLTRVNNTSRDGKAQVG